MIAILPRIISNMERKTINEEDTTMLVTIRKQIKRTKSFKDYSVQIERIITLYYQGYGNDRMYTFCEETYFRLLKENGGY